MDQTPALEWTADYVLQRVGLGAERAAWMWLLDRAEAYPADKFMPALRSPRRQDSPRKLVVAQLHPEVGADNDTEAPSAVLYSDGRDVEVAPLDGSAGGAEGFARALLTKRTRGHLVAFWSGGRGAFHTILRTLAPGLLERGYSIQPLASGSDIKALIFRKGRQSWWLCDVQAMTGLYGSTEAEFVTAYAGGRRPGEHVLAALLRALRLFERELLDAFGVGLRVTLGASAMRAASYHVGENSWVWRPPPLAVTMSREGGGFRGGFAIARRYVGPAWSADLNKAYTSALAEPLPGRVALGSAGEVPHARPGIYLCEVRGPGQMPAYLARFAGYHEGFRRDYWNGEQCLAVLPSSEFAGLRALGYRVRAGFGFVTASTWTLAGFVERVERAVAAHPRGSAQHEAAKLIGNSVYGKLAENPDRMDVMYAAEQPGDEWMPYLTERGEEVPDVWESRSIAHRPHQHVNVAAAITGDVRGRLYAGIAAVQEAGGTVVHADTDGLLTTRDPAAVLDTDPDRLGAWRVSEEPEESVVWGRKGYVFGREVRAAGVQHLTPDEAQALAAGEVLELPLDVQSAPWKGRSGASTTVRQVRATA